MNPTDAAKLVSALDAELARRQSRKDAAEDKRWESDVGGDSLILMARRLARNWDRLQKAPPSSVSNSPEDVECLLEETLDWAKSLFSLAEAVERDEWRREAEAAGTLRVRKPLILPPRIRTGAERLAVASAKNGDDKPAKKLSRTEAWAMQEQEKLQARMARLMPPRAGQESAGVWMHGTCQRYDSRSMSGVVAIGGGLGRLELPFGAAAIMRAGITTLHPSQSVECRITKQPDGTMVVTEIRLSVGERAVKLAELERQAQAAEENYRVEVMRRRLH